MFMNLKTYEKKLNNRKIIITFSLRIDVCLGEGNFGVVHAAKLRDPQHPLIVRDVALKRLKSKLQELLFYLLIQITALCSAVIMVCCCSASNRERLGSIPTRASYDEKNQQTTRPDQSERCRKRARHQSHWLLHPRFAIMRWLRNL